MSVDIKQNCGFKSPLIDSNDVQGFKNKHWAKRNENQRNTPRSECILPSGGIVKSYEEKLFAALRERDEMWQRHEKQQIECLQKQHSQLLVGLHAELERLQNINRELERQLFVKSEPSKSEMEKLKVQLSNERSHNARFRKDLINMGQRNVCLAQTLERTAHLYKSQIAQYEKKIARLNARLKEIMSLNAHVNSEKRASVEDVRRFGNRDMNEAGNSCPEKLRHRSTSNSKCATASSSKTTKLPVPQNKHIQ